jgi:RNA polymerase sigma-70 factor (ECF subfamily)
MNTLTQQSMKDEDAQLVRAAQQGDAAAFRALVERYQRKALSVAVGILRDPDAAHDAVQEAFLKVHQRIQSFEGGSQFFTWLYRIVVNLCIDHLRRRRLDCVDIDDLGSKESEWAADRVAPAAIDPCESLAAKELRARLRDAFNKLSPAHRTVITLRELNGCSYKEIAQVMNCSLGTVMSRLFNARKYMQAMLADEPEIARLAA